MTQSQSGHFLTKIARSQGISLVLSHVTREECDGQREERWLRKAAQSQPRQATAQRHWEGGGRSVPVQAVAPPAVSPRSLFDTAVGFCLLFRHHVPLGQDGGKPWLPWHLRGGAPG